MKNGLQKGGRVVISYAPLWETMKKRGVTTYALINKHGVSPYTITMLKRNQSITMNTLEKLCKQEERLIKTIQKKYGYMTLEMICLLLVRRIH